MNSSAFNVRVLSAIAVLSAASWGMSAFAQTAPGKVAPANTAASAPGPVERAENATKKAAKATANAASKAVDATKKGVKKAADAVARTGKKIGEKIPGPKASEQSQEDQSKPATTDGR